MGLFDIFKKKKTRCCGCLQVIDGYVQFIEDQPYCQACYLKKMGNLNYKGEQKNDDIQFKVMEEELLDDITFIREIKHTGSGTGWQQYDILMEARAYGWEMMIKWADYMAKSDFAHIDQVTVANMGMPANNITDAYQRAGSFSQMEELETESGILSVAGLSKTLHSPLKIVWFNQSRVLRMMTWVKDQVLMEKYAETVIRQTFGTDQAMKRGQPILDKAPEVQ